jgi:hypothetical protein
MKTLPKIKNQLFIKKGMLLTYLLLAGSILFLVNPGLYWDDWVWAFKSPEEALAIGRELGIWWGGYATNFINSQENPALVMRVFGWFAWVAASLFFARALYEKKLIVKGDAFWVFLICSTTYLATIRYFISASFYNIYIASFWFGIFILSKYKISIKSQIIATPFIFFSFYLNSLIAIFGLIIFYLFTSDCCVKIKITKSDILEGEKKLDQSIRLMDYIKADYKSEKFFNSAQIIFVKLINNIHEFYYLNLTRLINKKNYDSEIKFFKNELIIFIRKYYLLMLIPLVFIFLKKLSIEKSPAYDTYNQIDLRILFTSIFTSIGMLPKILSDYVIFASRATKSNFIWLNFIIIFMLLRGLAKGEIVESRWRGIGVPLIAGLMLLAISIYPYLVVHKVPSVSDYYESRHLLPAIPAIALFYIGLINALSALIKNYNIRNLFKNILLSYLLALNIGASQIFGIQLWQDWERQVGIMNYIQTNIEKFKDTNTFIFSNPTNYSAVGGRNIWNYEYTGNLIKVYGTKDKLGIGIDEYLKWDKNVLLLNSEFYRKRYNIINYDFNGKHALIYIFSKNLNDQIYNSLKFAYEYLLGMPYQATIDKKFLFEHSFEFIEANKRVPLILDIRDALEAYKSKYGFYPSQSRRVSGINLSGSGMPFDKYFNYIPALFPEFMIPPDGFQLQGDVKDLGNEKSPGYIYISNGFDYKLVYSNVLDLPYAKQAFPGFVDIKNNGYGVWSSGAQSW